MGASVYGRIEMGRRDYENGKGMSWGKYNL
jgi:hypothetical protein